MKKLKIVFFGLGSIGQRHAKIIMDKFDHEIFAFRTKLGQEKNNLNIPEYDKIEDVLQIKPDVAFITNPTFKHVETAIICAENNIDLFIEKPLSNNKERVEELAGLINENKIFSYVAYNMRFHPVIMHLKKLIFENKSPFYFRVNCSSYLPSWRKNQDYSKGYSAKKKYGGGVILDVSHEFDYISFLFGDIKNINGTYDKISDLNIETEDFAEAEILCNNNLKGFVHLDFFSKKNIRKIQIIYDNYYVEGDLVNNKIKIIDENNSEKITNFESGKIKTYEDQIEYFFNNYEKKNYELMNNFKEALKTFERIMDFKESVGNKL